MASAVEGLHFNYPKQPQVAMAAIVNSATLDPERPPLPP